jgi:hypothetical protein
MNLAHGLHQSATKGLSTAVLVGTIQILAPGYGNAQQAGWTGSAGMTGGCVGWNCDGKSPCTGMGCTDTSPTKDEKGGSTKAKSSRTAKSGTTKDSKGSTGASKRPPTKATQPLPDVGALSGKSENSNGWGGTRNTDTRTTDQRNQPDAKKAAEDLQRAVGGGKPPPGGWGGGLKSDSRTIEQKLDTP